MTALTILGIIIAIALIGAGDKPKTEEELKNDSFLNTNSSDVNVGRIILSLIFR